MKVDINKEYHVNERITLELARGVNGKNLVVEVSNTGCWNVISHKNGNPYPMYRKTRCHKLMYEKYIGEVPNGLVIRHTCDNYRCCNPNHLILGTQGDNVGDMIIRERSSQIMLSNEQIIDIANNDRNTVSELCEMYGVSKYVIYRIRNGTIRGGLVTKDTCDKKYKNKKLNNEEVLKIFTSELSYCELAELYNVSYTTIYDIKNLRTWKNITKKMEVEDDKNN